jgi:putative nucleotidyltransferase with HDIG domain
MKLPRQAPALLVKTLAVTFTMMALLLAVVFAVVVATIGAQVTASVSGDLRSTQRLFASFEERRQRDLRSQALSLAENSTLKAALDTYASETRSGDAVADAQLVTTVTRELEKIAARVDTDVVVALDTRRNTIAAAGPFADRWPRGLAAAIESGSMGVDEEEGVVQAGAHIFRVVSVPLLLQGGQEQIGALLLATSLDQPLAQDLDRVSAARIAIMSGNRLLATTLSPPAAAAFTASIQTAGDDMVDLAGESFAFTRLVQLGDTRIYALGSIDQSWSTAMRPTILALAPLAIGAGLLAFAGSFYLARSISTPIGRLSAALARMAETHHVEGRLALDGSSRELDALTRTFNELMASVAEAEAQTDAAYTGAIRGLAAALDARDPYTAGHSERVSVLSVAIGRTLGLPQGALEILRLGALLHDIGKIGVPDEILRKPAALTAAEYDAIRQHPVLGARILRNVPFLSPHLPIVELHHERPDGRGYPFGLVSEDIPVAARIVHVADAYDAITSARAYRRARPSGEALRELWRCAGTEFHAEIVGALAAALPALTADGQAAVYETVAP